MIKAKQKREAIWLMMEAQAGCYVFPSGKSVMHMKIKVAMRVA
jgi:hypothetical protein